MSIAKKKEINYDGVICYMRVRECSCAEGKACHKRKRYFSNRDDAVCRKIGEDWSKVDQSRIRSGT